LINPFFQNIPTCDIPKTILRIKEFSDFYTFYFI